MIRLFLSASLFILTIYSSAQLLQLRKTIIVYSNQCVIFLPDKFVIPSSITLFDIHDKKTISAEYYTYDTLHASIHINELLCNDTISVLISYRCLKLPDTQLIYQHIQNKNESSNNQIDYLYFSKSKIDISNSGELQKWGIITRGIQTGNRSSPSLTSSIDIQLWGTLHNEIEVQAVITDQSIPFQPQGNTQQIHEFDKVFVSLKKNNFFLQAGDLNLSEQKYYFNRYTKKARGLTLSSTIKQSENLFKSDDTATHSYMASVGLSKGRFARNTIQGQEGNQGPYKLKGVNNEIYIMILAGTEKVYLNGQLLVRGEHNDYIIDYNLAELYFTPRCPITWQSRIIVEFQYSEKYYLQPIINTSYQYIDRKFQFNIHTHLEQDAKRQSLSQHLTENDIFLLEQSTTTNGMVLVPGWDTTAFSIDYILYEMIDTLGYDSVFVHSVDQNKILYKVFFSYVGNGLGDYVIEKNIANGRVFKWVAPKNGKQQGEYVPYRVIVAPRKHNVYSFSTTYNLSKNTNISLDLSLSNKDVNTFSQHGHSTGYASRIFINNKFPIFQKDTININSIQQQLYYEFVQSTYEPLEQFRSIEFFRDWNQSITSNNNQQMFGHILSFVRQHNLISSLRTECLIQNIKDKAIRNELFFKEKINNLYLQTTLSYLMSDKDTLSTDFFRQKSSLSVNKKQSQIGIESEQEVNIWKATNNRILEQSFSFYDLSPFIMLQANKNLTLKSWFRYRPTKQAIAQNLTKTSEWFEYGANIRQQQRNHTLQFDYVHRKILYYKPKHKKEQTSLAQIKHTFWTNKQSLESTMFYEISSGNEIKKEISYVEVMPGHGQYEWNDYNGNGIKEIDEFELAKFQDRGQYIRIILPGTEYIRIYPLRYTYTLNFRPERQFPTIDNKILKLLCRFSGEANINFTSKDIDLKPFDLLKPFKSYDETDTTNIFYNSNVMTSLFFNRGHPLFNIRYKFFRTQQKLFLISGSDYSQKHIHEISFFLNLTKSIGIEPTFEQEFSKIFSESSLLRNFSYTTSKYIFYIHYQVGSSSRYSLFISNKQSTSDQFVPPLKAHQYIVGTEVRLNISQATSLISRSVFHLIKYNGPLNHPIAYHTLESMTIGKNFTCNILLHYQISQIFMIFFSMESRFSENNKPIYFGTIQFRAILR